jgi:hypothetical protein
VVLWLIVGSSPTSALIQTLASTEPLKLPNPKVPIQLTVELIMDTSTRQLGISRQKSLTPRQELLVFIIRCTVVLTLVPFMCKLILEVLGQIDGQRVGTKGQGGSTVHIQCLLAFRMFVSMPYIVVVDILTSP